MPSCCCCSRNNFNENGNADGAGENYDEPSSYVSTPPLGSGIFDECDPTFYMFSLIHCKYGMFIAAVTGLLGTCAVFTVCLCFFRWYFYETTVDIIAVTGFSVFLLSGVFVHILVLRAINKTKAVLLTPFIIFHAFLLLMETIMALTAVGQIVSDQDAHYDESDVLAREILLTSPFCIFIQVLMLYCGIKYRNYARRKEAYDHTIHSINPVLSFQNTVSPTASFDIAEDKY